MLLFFALSGNYFVAKIADNRNNQFSKLFKQDQIFLKVFNLCYLNIIILKNEQIYYTEWIVIK